jgi:predicted nucleotidyltransferase
VSDVGSKQGSIGRGQVLATLRGHASELRSFGVSHLFLFGSVCRDQAGTESDVDLFFDFDDPHFSGIELLRLKDRVEELLSRPVDLMTRSSLHPRLRNDIEQSALPVF